MEGWVKIHRKLQKWEWYQDSKMVHLFIHILFSANYEEKKWKGIKVMRGQFITGLKSLNKDTGISYQSLRTCLVRLEDTGEINRLTNNRYSIITITNYDSYQLTDEEANRQTNKQLTNKQQTTNKQTTTTKKLKKPRIEEIKKYCDERNNNIDIEYFFDSNEAKGWVDKNGNPYKDWKAVIRTWEKFSKNKPESKNLYPGYKDSSFD